jgi:HAD superfamily hydrolase (TIGR01450 family)
MVAANGSLLVDAHDCLLLDLDGTVFRGSCPVPGALETLDAIGARTLFLTNNASRSAAQVADHLRDLGFSVSADDVVTSAQTAAGCLASNLTPGSAVLVVGTNSLAAEIEAIGLQAVRSHADAPVAVIQGHSPHTTWVELAEAALAIRGGALWIATNADMTLPSERGLLPGNGAMIAALRAATDAEPHVVGKPGAAMFHAAMARGTFRAPLVVGDRLDTDIAGANAAGMPSLLVLTGVSTPRALLSATHGQRPTYLGQDLRSLHLAASSLRIGPQPGWHTEIAENTVIVTSTGEGEALSAVRAAIHAVWKHGASSLIPGDQRSRDALRQWRFG